MRKIFTFIFALIVGAGTVFGASGTSGGRGAKGESSASGTWGENLTWNVNDEGVLTISGTGNMWWQESEFVELWYDWWEYKSFIRSVVIGDGVTSIGKSAFAQFSTMTSLTIGKSVTMIEEKAFFDCNALPSVVLPSSVTYIGEAAFWCESLSSITCEAITPPECGEAALMVHSPAFVFVPEASVAAYSSAPEWENFAGRIYPIGTVITPDVIATGTFGAEGKNLTWKLTDNGLLSISGTGAMPEWNTTSEVPWLPWDSYILSVVIGNEVTTIGANAFFGCSQMSSVTIGNNVSTIGKNVFYNCYKLSLVTIPNSVTSIGGHAFTGCEGLHAISLGNKVASIGEWAFEGCTALSSITCEAVEPPTCGKNCFSGVDKSIPVYVPGRSVGAYGEASEWCGFEHIRPIPGTEVPVYAVTLYADNGTVYVEETVNLDSVPEDTELHLTAIPDEGYKFIQWSDEVKNNPRTVTVTSDTTFTALFEEKIVLDPNKLALWIVPMSGEEKKYALSLIGRITFDEEHIYLHDLQGELLGEQALSSIRKIVFRELEQVPTSLTQPQTNIRVYPIPARELLVVEGVEGNELVRVYSMQGVLVTDAPVHEGKAQVQVSELPEGNYLLQAGVEIIKFIKK